MVLLITYDLRKPGKNYQALYNEIKASGTWWHHLESVWMIETQSTPEAWYNQLAQHLDAGDHLLIIRVQRPFQGWLPQNAWDWLNARTF